MLCAHEGCTSERVGESKYCKLHRDAAHMAFLARVRQSSQEKAEKVEKFTKLHEAADRAGNEAALLCKTVPMVVEQHANMMDDSSPVTQRWVVEGGVCGFAWVVIRPGTCSFARWAKANIPYTDKHYYGGVSIWCPLGTQSMAIKEAYCEAYAKVLREAGIKAYAQSRID